MLLSAREFMPPVEGGRMGIIMSEEIMQKQLHLKLREEDFNKLQKRYHFLPEDKEKLMGLYQAILPLTEARAYYVWKECNDKIAYENYGIFFVTLGEGIDELQEVYIRKQCLTEAYMTDCIGLELLMKAYEELIKHVQRETGKWAAKIDFLGDTYPIELLPELYQDFADKIEVKYNQNFILSPSKSVVFLLPMHEEKKGNPCHICDSCSNVFCLFRQGEEGKEGSRFEKRLRLLIQAKQQKLKSDRGSYGIQNIFGNETKH